MTLQPQQARRGTAVVAGSTLLVGVLLVVLSLVLTACSGGSSSPQPDRSQASTSRAPSSSPVTSAAPASTPAASTPAPATTSTPDTTGGLPVQPPVSIASPASFGSGVTSTVISIEPITATAALPGEISGPAVRLTVAVQNTSATALDLGNVTVDLQDAAGVSATSLSGNGSAPFTGTVQPGGSATGAYVFTVAANDRTGVRLYVTVSTSLPVVVFTGDLPMP